MPRQYLMTWDEKAERWFKWTPKKYERIAPSRVMKVSCRQLGMPGTKTGSYRAANQWWQELVSQWDLQIARAAEDEFPQATQDAETLDEMADWLRQRNRSEEAEQKAKLAATIRSAIKQGQEPEYDLRDMFAHGSWDIEDDVEWRVQQESDLNVWNDRLRDQTARKAKSDKQLRTWVESYKTTIGPTTKPQSMRNIGRHLREFTDWFGETTSVETIDEQTVDAFYGYLQKNGKAPSTNRDTFRMTFRRFVTFLAESKQISLPLNLRSQIFRFYSSTTPDYAEKSEIRDAVTIAGNEEGMLQLFVLLALNCGMNNADIGMLQNTDIDWKVAQKKLNRNKLRFGHVDWANGRLTRQRVKTEGKGTDIPVVTYALWPETLQLLKNHRSSHAELCLTTGTGGPLWLRGEKRKDEIYQAFKRCKNMSITPKQLRAGGATLLDDHEVYGRFVTHYLANSPRGVADRNYKAPSQQQFDKLVEWLRVQVMPKKKKRP